MMKLTRSLFLARNLLSEKLLVGKVDNAKDALCLHSLLSRAGMSTTGQSSGAGGIPVPRIFAPYSIYKGKAAVSVNPILPTFTKMDSGHFRVERKGCILLTFWPAVGERKYDWGKKQVNFLFLVIVITVFALSATEGRRHVSDKKFCYSNAGQVRKSLSIKAVPDGTGYFVSLNVVNNLTKITERFVVPVTTAEFIVMKTACSYALPHIMGWHRLTNQQLGDSAKKPFKIDPQLLDLEWDK
ncbi:hypothetical protein JRO89_XSUnG0025000 [Xanthoceras sorbifolium]|uniref:Uncharacterized protein n=1 Tax=Xanthoceras sorbifolium TaxID=99658 RepID=A0ABQ8H065_9ROSI|nr:hypothetical protein JRO89_XSUnG0025000 [Xanthoceras sorbifolium]